MQNDGVYIKFITVNGGPAVYYDAAGNVVYYNQGGTSAWRSYPGFLSSIFLMSCMSCYYPGNIGLLYTRVQGVIAYRTAQVR